MNGSLPDGQLSESESAWAFSGCESITLSSDEKGFPVRKTFYFLVAAIVCGAVVYILLTMQAAMAPEASEASIPVFEAARAALGPGGMLLMGVSVFCTISTSLLGFYRGAGKILYAKAQDGVFPKWFGVTNRNGKPRNAIFFIMLISFFIPFLGRTSLSWLTDITTVCITIVYAYISACAIRIGKNEGRPAFRIFGCIGIVSSAVCFLFPLIPSQLTLDELSTGSYAMLILWSLGGFLLYRSIFKHDQSHHFGNVTVMFFLLLLICFSSTMWMKQLTHTEVDSAMDRILTHYMQDLELHHTDYYDEIHAEEQQYLSMQHNKIHSSIFINCVVQLLLNILPAEVAKELAEHPDRTIAQHFPNVTEATFVQTKDLFSYSGGVNLEVKGKGRMKSYYLQVD